MSEKPLVKDAQVIEAAKSRLMKIDNIQSCNIGIPVGQYRTVWFERQNTVSGWQFSFIELSLIRDCVSKIGVNEYICGDYLLKSTKDGCFNIFDQKTEEWARYKITVEAANDIMFFDDILNNILNNESPRT